MFFHTCERAEKSSPHFSTLHFSSVVRLDLRGYFPSSNSLCNWVEKYITLYLYDWLHYTHIGLVNESLYVFLCSLGYAFACGKTYFGLGNGLEHMNSYGEYFR